MKNYQEFVDTVGLKDLQSCVGSTDGLVVCCFLRLKWGKLLLFLQQQVGHLFAQLQPQNGAFMLRYQAMLVVWCC